LNATKIRCKECVAYQEIAENFSSPWRCGTSD